MSIQDVDYVICGHAQNIKYRDTDSEFWVYWVLELSLQTVAFFIVSSVQF